MKMNENNYYLVPEERLNLIRNYFSASEYDKPIYIFPDDKHQATCELSAAEGMRDAFIYRLESLRGRTKDFSLEDIESAIERVNRRYDELQAEYEKGSQTVILH